MIGLKTRGGSRLMEKGGQNELRYYRLPSLEERPKKGHNLK